MTRLVHESARLIDAATGESLRGADLVGRIDATIEAYAGHRAGAVFATMPTQIDAIVRYVAAVEVGRPVALVDQRTPARVLTDLVERFEPELVLADPTAGSTSVDLTDSGYLAEDGGALGPRWRRIRSAPLPPHPDLGLLLPTSGSTGNPKLVRLSRAALLANTASIATALGIDGGEVAVTTLPLHYSYGMSVLNSHLFVGATVLLDRSGLTARDFWSAIEQFGATSMAAVPYQYEMLRRLRFDPARYPRLRTLTQAGGRLAPELIADFHARMAGVGGQLFVMYGQTEAAPRMTTLPSTRLPDKLGSAGLPIPGGTIAVENEAGRALPPAETGEIIYAGPNVMMGYAQSAADLARGDEQGGRLATGDLGHLDDEGFLYITGRLKRITKVFGVRVNLDDIERLISHHSPLAAVAGSDKVVIIAEGADTERLASIQAEVAAGINTHSSGIVVRSIDALPLTAAGKIDYRALEESGL